MSKLEEISKPFRDILIAKNDYSETDPYNVSNPDALSDGDEKGRGLGSAGTIGTKTDISERSKELAKNKYSYNKEYNIKTA